MEIISADHYIYIYILCVSILTLITLNQKPTMLSLHQKYFYSNNYSSVNLFLASVILGLFIGFRPVSNVFVDMVGTARSWEIRIENVSMGFPVQNFIYDRIPFYINLIGGGSRFFFVCVSLFYFVGTAFACKRFFGSSANLAFLVWLGAFSTFSYSTNGIKAGAAATCFLLALSFYKNKIVALLLLIITIGMHHSMTLPIGAFILSKFIRRPKIYLYFWIISLLFSFAHITSIMEWLGNFIAGGGDEHGADYLLGNQELNSTKGLRLDFILYSSMPVLIGYIAIFKYKIKSDCYKFLWNVYVICNSFWMLCMYASFTNRIAYLSWMIYPIVLIYPFLNEVFIKRQVIWLKRVILIHLGFTLFMFLIYY